MGTKLLIDNSKSALIIHIRLFYVNTKSLMIDWRPKRERDHLAIHPDRAAYQSKLIEMFQREYH